MAVEVECVAAAAAAADVEPK
ncbi:hypothetical protein Tco_0742260, partial [Tanacetum coccineum]